MNKIRSQYFLYIVALTFFSLSTSFVFPKEIVIPFSSSDQKPIPPYLWYNHCDKRFSGYYPKLLSRLSSDTGVKITQHIRNSAFKDMQTQRYDAVKSGVADIFTANQRFQKDPELMMGKEPILVIQPVFVLNKSLPEIKEIKELSPYVGSFTGEYRGSLADSLAGYGLNLHAKDFTLKQFLGLESGEVDYVIVDKRVANYFVKKFDKNHQYRMLYFPLPNSHVHLFVRRGDTEHEKTLMQFDQRIALYRREGLLDKLIYNQLERWFAVSIDCLTPPL